jgi:DNA (cytosine-5)-methyltransferase 1
MYIIPKGKGFADERHVWPAFFHLIEECRPVVVFGEQVASRDGLAWVDLVRADLEGAEYAVGVLAEQSAGQRAGSDEAESGRSCGESAGPGEVGMLADAEHDGHDRPEGDAAESGGDGSGDGVFDGGGGELRGPCNGFWGDAEWIACIDGKWRAVEPGSFPLAHGVAGRVGRLRGYGNAINAEQARAFVEAYRFATDKHGLIG